MNRPAGFRVLLLLCMLEAVLHIAPVHTSVASAEAAASLCPERMPQFPGNLNTWLSANLHYPATARRAGIQGRVKIRFVINESGYISNVRIVEAPSIALMLEAIRVVAIMPRWKPGVKDCKPTKVWYTLPIRFQLE